MTYEVLLNNKILHLPIKQTKKSFEASISSVLTLFLDKVNQLDEGPLQIEGLRSIDAAYVKTVQRKFIEGLLKIIRAYYNGLPAEAFLQLTQLMQNELKDYTEILKIKEYNVGEFFYRIRIKKENFPLSVGDMFHIPFQLRGKIITQRYSIPGFPCLYLGRTIYGCWEELGRPNINEFQVSSALSGCFCGLM